MSLRDFRCIQLPGNRQPRPSIRRKDIRRSIPFEGAISEVQSNATEDAIHSLPGYRAARKLAELYGLDPSADWEEVESYRDTLEYDQLCDMNMQSWGSSACSRMTG